jgi:hypothetical protein
MTTNSPNRRVISAETLADDANHIRAEVRRRGLKVASVSGGGIPVNEFLDVGIEALKGIIDRRVIVGASNLVMGGSKARVSRTLLQDNP